MRTLKVLGFLLTYPTPDHLEVLDECREILKKEKWLPERALTALDGLMRYLQEMDILTLQEEYVALFDRTPSLCLHLFEHIHGDSRDRGQALVDLMNVYNDAGLELKTEELPDYLPLFLEYLSVIETEQARHDLNGLVEILAVIGKRLENRDSAYAAIFDALIDAAGRKPDEAALQRALKEKDGTPLSIEEMDKIWEEQHAFENSLQTTGQDMGGCPKADEMLARIMKE